MYRTKDIWGDGDLNILIFICYSGIQLAMSGGQAVQGLPVPSTSVSITTQPVNWWHATLALCSQKEAKHSGKKTSAANPADS